MPGVVMDHANVGGVGRDPDPHSPRNGVPTPLSGVNQPELSADRHGGLVHLNGVTRSVDECSQQTETSTVKFGSMRATELPELPHITQGFFPFTTLVNRSVQQCWNDLSDLITELAEVQVSPQESNPLPMSTNSKSSGNQTPENLQKKLRILDFAHAKRAEFIKLLVLSQWSRQAADVSKLIDLQNLIRTRHQAYMGALQCIGDMKRDLVQAQVANPDIKTALEVLSKAEVVSMPDLGYRPPRALTPKSTLKKLQRINRIISARLALSDLIPRPFQTYRVHDGRVTFAVPGEFALDLSIGEEDESSQFYFVDIRFLFNPSSSIPPGRMFNELDIKINDILRNSGLTGCFELLHSLVLTNKINALFKQAAELTRGLWSEILRIELLHRTLVVHYWALKPGPKSWLEIGIKSGRRKSQSKDSKFPFLGLRWMRDGQEIDSKDVEFDTENLSMECILRSVIALHISHILSLAYKSLSESLLFASGMLSLRAQLTGTEPGDCQLDIQLTTSRHLRVSIEPMSGASIFSATPSALERPDSERGPDKFSVDDIVSRISRLRCVAAIEEIESSVKILGFETVNPRSLKIDFRRLFPANVLRFSFFWHRLWERNWILAATSSMDGDNWWIVQLRPVPPTNNHLALDQNTHSQSIPRSAQVISNTLFPVQEQVSYASSADMGHCLSGVLAIYANARYLADLQSVNFFPPLNRLVVGPELQVPDILIRYEPESLPRAFQLALPAGLKKKTYIKNAVRLAFHGVDTRKKVTILVAYGSLLIPAKAFGVLSAKWDRSLVFSKRGNGFAIRLLAPAGRPVIVSLMENLQRLECVLSVLDTIQRKKMESRTLSLSQIAFTYGPHKDLSAIIDIGLSVSHAEAEPEQLATHTDPLFHLRLGIHFNHPNPHRRIQRSLATILNHASTDTGLDAIVELLSLTLPLMRALDHITPNPTHSEPLRMQVTVRNAKTFQICYPSQNFRFQLIASQHMSHMAWILKDVSHTPYRSSQEPLVSTLRDKIFNFKGDGWRGLGNGVVAEVDKVGNLILELDKCFIGIREGLGSSFSGPEAKLDLRNLSQPAAMGQTGSGGIEGISLAGGIPATGSQPKADVLSQNADIITID